MSEHTTSHRDAQDELLLRALEEYHRSMDAEGFSREAFLQGFPSIAGKLRQCVGTLDSLRELVPEETRDTELRSQPTLGDFRIIRELGRGGMGIVYEAQQLSLERRVALKVLPLASLLDARQLKRFRIEARTAAMLKHPNIVSVYAVGVERSIHYYAMELIDGLSVSEVATGQSRETASSNPIDTTSPVAQLSTDLSSRSSVRYKRIARLGIRVADALQYAHDQGIVHRDIKPANLLLDREGTIHVADFGLARIQTQDDLTLTGDVVGTLRYMSPEQLHGRPVDGRTDVYSLGLTLYELISQRPAFAAKDRAGLSRQIAEGEIPLLRSIASGVPRDLENIVHRAISRNADARYNTARELGEDLLRFVDNKPVHARRVSKLELIGRWCARNKAKAGLIGLSLCVLVALAVLGPLYAQQQTALLEEQKQLAETRREELYAAHMKEVYEAMQRGDHLHANELLELYVPDGDSPRDLRGFEWKWLRSQLRRQRLAPTYDSEGLSVHSVARSPDGTKIVLGTYLKNVLCIDSSTLDTLWQLRGWSPIWHSVQFSADGRFVVAGSDNGNVELLYSRDGSRASERLALRDAISQLALSCDNVLVVGYGEGLQVDRRGKPAEIEVFHLDSSTGKLEPAHINVDAGWGVVRGLAFSPDGQTLAGVSEESLVRRWSMPDFKPLAPLRIGERTPTGIAQSSDGRLVVTTVLGVDRIDPRMHFFDHEKQVWTAGLDAESTHSAFSQDGRRIVTSTTNGQLHVFDGETGNALDTVSAHCPAALAVTFGRTHQELFSAGADGTVRRWRIHDRPAPRDMWLEPQAVMAAAWFHDSQHVVVGGLRGAIQIINRSTGEVFESPPSSPHIISLAVSSDNQQVAVGRYGMIETRKLDLANRTIGDAVVLSDDQATVFDVHFLRSGKQLLTASDGNAESGLMLWDTHSGSVTHRFHAGSEAARGYFRCAVSPDENYVAATVFNRNVIVWRMRDSEPIAVLHPSEETRTKGFYALAFSKDGQSIVIGDTTGRILSWNFHEDEIQKTFLGHRGGVASLDFSAEGRLVSGGIDQTVRIWDVKSGRELLVSRTDAVWNWRTKFSPDGFALVAGGGGPRNVNKLRFWRVTPPTASHHPP